MFLHGAQRHGNSNPVISRAVNLPGRHCKAVSIAVAIPGCVKDSRQDTELTKIINLMMQDTIVSLIAALCAFASEYVMLFLDR